MSAGRLKKTDIGVLEFDSENSGAGKGYEKARLLTFRENSRFLQISNQKDDRSVMKVTASMYLFCCCFYNSCCCCFPQWLIGPVCGKKFCCKYATQCEIRLTRDRWLGIMHALCFTIHATMACLSFAAGAGKPMEISIHRVKPLWDNTGRNGYIYAIQVEDIDLRIDTLTGTFFLLSAFFHFIWVVPSLFFPSLWSYMTSYIDKCFCPWCALEPSTHCTNTQSTEIVHVVHVVHVVSFA